MRHIRLIASLTIAASLTACGGGGGGDDATSYGELPAGDKPTTVAPCREVVKVALYGDSTMHSNGIAPAVAQREFDAKFGAGRVIVFGLGVPGELGWNAAQTMRPTDYDVSVANYGINDCGASMSAPAFASALRLMVSKGLTALETPNPVTHRVCTGYNDLVVDIALEAGLPIVDTEAFVAAHGGTTRLTDRIHPNAELYTEIAVNRAQQLAPLVEARLCKAEQTITTEPEGAK